MKLKRTMQILELSHTVVQVNNGEEALEGLQKGEFLPDIIVSDLHMPILSGTEFLEILKADIKLRHLPVIILSSSDNLTELKKCYELGIAGYMIKPLKFEDYMDQLKSLMDYWSFSAFVKS